MYQFLTGGNVACAATLRTRRGTPAVFPFLPINPIPFRTRFARKSKWRFGIAARPPQRVSKSGLPPQKGAQRAPAQHPCEVATIFFRVLTDNVRARIPAPGRSVAFMQTTSASLASTAPPPPGPGAKLNCRDVIANQIFPQNVDKFVCGRGQSCTSPAGVIRKRGRSAPSSRAAASVHASNRRFAAALSES